LFNLLHN